MNQDSQFVVEVDRIGKQYRLGRDHADSLVDKCSEFLGRLVGNRSQSHIFKPKEFWALRDVSFQVKSGETFGIIGKNGAGKSTLLKLISRVIAPTSGQIILTGRIASLLEVGTGFHPDLTGLENIYMNASLLGMSRKEVASKLDDIVDFAGVSDFLGTPVKRYSSGMRVRLGFAVAAHLEPEILIIDEVLTVGDAEFQKKCLGKMQSVANEGRTVLFVSHNMAAVRSLCTRACLLDEGRLTAIGDTGEIVQAYLNANGYQSGWTKQYADSALIKLGEIHVARPLTFQVGTMDLGSCGVFSTEQPIEFQFEFIPLRPLNGFRAGIAVKSTEGLLLFGSNVHLDPIDSAAVGKPCLATCTMPGNLLNRGSYVVDVAIDCLAMGRETFEDQECVQFEVVDVLGHGDASEPLPGVIRPKLNWKLDLDRRVSP